MHHSPTKRQFSLRNYRRCAIDRRTEFQMSAVQWIEDENNKTHHKVFNKRIKMPNVRKPSKMKTNFSSSRPLIQIIRAPIQYKSRHCTTPTELINGISPEPSIIISICSVWCTICAIPLNQNHSINYDNKRIYTMPSTCFFLSCFSHQSARPTRQRQ